MIIKKPKFWDDNSKISKLFSLIFLPLTIPFILNNFFLIVFPSLKLIKLYLFVLAIYI